MYFYIYIYIVSVRLFTSVRAFVACPQYNVLVCIFTPALSSVSCDGPTRPMVFVRSLETPGTAVGHDMDAVLLLFLARGE